jgi:hypothetical protein
MFRVGSAVCSNFGFFAKSLTSGFTKSAFAEHGGSSFQNPTISLPRIRIISWCSSTQQKRGTNPFRYNSLHRTRRLSNMASTKEYRLLCLENPLLDIQAFGNEELLKKYDLKANDAILAEPKHLGIYEDLLNNYDAKLIAGGAAQNTARGAQVCRV